MSGSERGGRRDGGREEGREGGREGGGVGRVGDRKALFFRAALIVMRSSLHQETTYILRTCSQDGWAYNMI